MSRKVLMDLKPSLVLVPGDTNSALASALIAVKMNFKVAHIVAGARSYGMSMPEEINRRVVDHYHHFCSQCLKDVLKILRRRRC